MPGPRKTDSLIPLQDLDLRIHQIKVQSAEKPRQLAAFEQKVTHSQENVTVIGDEIRALKLEGSRRELTVKEYDERITKLQTQSMTAKKNDEYQAFQKEISGIKAEQEATFIFLIDQRKPTGPMAGVRIQDGKVDLIFINNRFAYKTRGIFRSVLNSESPEDIRKLLGKEEYGDENVMGAVMAYDTQGFLVNYLGKDINIEFAQPH